MLLLFAVIGLFAQDIATEKCAIAGTVVDSVTGEPLGKAELRLQVAVGSSAYTAATTTDGMGRFAFAGLDSGRFRLTARRNGYLETAYGALRPNAEGTVLQLEAGRAVNDLKVKLTAAGVIAGVVRDADGEPLEGVSMALGQMRFRNGRRLLESIDSVESDDRGEYRFRGVQPGKYFVSAEAKTGDWWNSIDFSAIDVARDVSVPTYYPGVPDAKLAAPMNVGVGERVMGIDIALIRSRTTRVRGSISGAPAGATVNLMLSKPDGEGMNHSLHRTVTRGAVDFEFRQVPQGIYILTARCGGLVASKDLHVGSSGVEGLRIALEPTATLEARITVAGEKRRNFQGFSLWLAKTDSGYSPNCRFEADGVCALQGVLTGRYVAFWSPLPRGFYMKGISSGNNDVLNDGIEVSGGGRIVIELAVAQDAASVSGVVLDKDGHPVPGAIILVAPQRHSGQDRFQSTTTDQVGRYEIESLAPGRYRAFAWRDVEPGAWEDPEFLAPYEKGSVSFVAEPGLKVTVDVQLPPVEP